MAVSGERKEEGSPKPKLTFMGDSTIDNRIWIDGFAKSWLYTHLGIQRDTPEVRVQQSHRICWKPALSVVENVMDMMPDHEAHDYTNDGFTTSDVLYGANKDKVFGRGTFSLFPDEFFSPLTQGAESIRNSTHIIVSVGGNDFREFLLEARKHTTRQGRAKYIRGYDLLLMPPNIEGNLRLVEEGKIYIKNDGKYLVKWKGMVHEGFLNHRENWEPNDRPLLNLDNLSQKISGTAFKSEVLEITSSRWHTPYNLETVLKVMRDRYIKIIQHIRNLNADAKIILMTQYYPSASQNTYGIYPFMREIGAALNIGGMFHSPMSVIHDIMKMTYSDVLKRVPPCNIIVADITSSLNPYDSNNHVSQIEPSGSGGKKIAQMLKYIMTSDKIEAGQAYRFFPDFFTAKNKENHDNQVEGTVFNQWVPAHPYDLREGYTLEEEKIFRQYDADRSALLQTFDTTLSSFAHSNLPIYQAGLAIREEGERLLHLMPEGDVKRWKMSIILAIHVLKNLQDPEAIGLLEANIAYRALGKSNGWIQFYTALSGLVGVAIIGLSIASIPFTSGASVAGLKIAGGVLTAGGATLFYHNRQKSLAGMSSVLAKEARRQLVPH